MVAPDTTVPLTFHWNPGVVPPLTGEAVYVIEVPEQTGLADAAIEMLTGSNGLTDMLTAFDIAGFPVIQVAFEVKIQVTISLFAGMYEKVALFVPAFAPLTFHW